MDTVVRGTSLPGREDPVDIGMDSGRIAAIESRIKGLAKDEVDGSGCLAVPGLIDSHAHLDKAMLPSGYVEGTPQARGKMTRQLKKEFTVEDIKDRARRVLEMAIRHGTLAMRTNVDVDPRVGDRGIQALLALREEYRDQIILQVTAFAQDGLQEDSETEDLLHRALEAGADGVGGHTSADPDGAAHIDTIFDIAKAHDVAVDFHVDETARADDFLMPYIAQKTRKEGFNGRVLAIHLSSLAYVEEDRAIEAVTSAADAGLRVAVAPSAIGTRRLTRVKELVTSGVSVSLGSDNIRDTFNPFGKADILQLALLLAYTKRFFTEAETNQVFEMITTAGARNLGVELPPLEPGIPANLTLLEGKTPSAVLQEIAPRRAVWRHGTRIV